MTTRIHVARGTHYQGGPTPHSPNTPSAVGKRAKLPNFDNLSALDTCQGQRADYMSKLHG